MYDDTTALLDLALAREAEIDDALESAAAWRASALALAVVVGVLLALMAFAARGALRSAGYGFYPPVVTTLATVTGSPERVTLGSPPHGAGGLGVSSPPAPIFFSSLVGRAGAWGVAGPPCVAVGGG